MGKSEMTRDDIIRMAQEADMDIDNDSSEWGSIITTEPADLERFAALVAAAEREACAKVCDEVHREYDGEEVSASWIAIAIRARGQA